MRSPNAPHRTRPITSSKVQRFRRLTVKQRNAVADAAAAGQSLLAAAEHVGVTTAAVYWHVTKTSSSVNGSGVHEAWAIRFGRASTGRVFIGSGGALRV